MHRLMEKELKTSPIIVGPSCIFHRFPLAMDLDSSAQDRFPKKLKNTKK